ncbi:MAG: glycoside hydrolase family 3 protein, partial [Deltaproteobacteria bacterium]|nr:glycoside hydrolase family 3 protein [Deltaproteobacteria bacterium]
QLPPMRVLGTLDHAGLARRAGAVVGEELRALGYNVDFAPVLDVDSNPKNPVIGDRSFGRNPLRVGELGTAFGLGLQDRGVLACGKHFPGHGDTSVDSHLALPVVHRTRAELEAVDLVPFRRAVEALGSLMTAHVVFDGLDPGFPATLSRKILHELLRREMGYTGLVFSDDLEMRALADRMTVEEAAVGAIRAGCDVLLVCQTPALADRAYEALVREAERDSEFLARVSHSAHWSRSARRRYPARPTNSTQALHQVFEESGAPGVLAELEGRRSLRP